MSKRTTLPGQIKSNPGLPAEKRISVVKATSSLAFGAFLGGDDLAMVFKSEVSDQKFVETARVERQKAIEKSVRQGKPVEEGKRAKQWFDASEKIRKEAHAGALTFRGRLAESTNGKPNGEERPIKAEFFAGEGQLVIGFGGALYRNDPTRPDVYYEVSVDRDEFLQVFPPPKLRHRASSEEKRDILAFAKQIHRKTGKVASEKEIRARFPLVIRSSIREVIHEFPIDLQLGRGGSPKSLNN